MSTAELIATLSEETAVRLSRAFGGKSLYVPENPSPDNPIAKEIGLDELRKLAARFRREILYIPVGPAVRARNRDIINLLRSGLDHNEVARQAGVSPRTVRHVSRFDRLSILEARQQIVTAQG